MHPSAFPPLTPGRVRHPGFRSEVFRLRRGSQAPGSAFPKQGPGPCRPRGPPDTLAPRVQGALAVLCAEPRGPGRRHQGSESSRSGLSGQATVRTRAGRLCLCTGTQEPGRVRLCKRVPLCPEVCTPVMPSGTGEGAPLQRPRCRGEAQGAKKQGESPPAASERLETWAQGSNAGEALLPLGRVPGTQVGVGGGRHHPGLLPGLTLP